MLKKCDGRTDGRTDEQTDLCIELRYAQLIMTESNHPTAQPTTTKQCWTLFFNPTLATWVKTLNISEKQG